MSERQEMTDDVIHVVNQYWYGSSRKWLVLNAQKLAWGVDRILGFWAPG